MGAPLGPWGYAQVSLQGGQANPRAAPLRLLGVVDPLVRVVHVLQGMLAHVRALSR